MSVKAAVARGAFALAERGVVADGVARVGIRRLVRSRLRSLADGSGLDLSTLRRGPIAPAPAEANEQHYEVPAEFFRIVLGPWRKYSSGYWPSPSTTFEQSETEMLELTCRRALLEDGQRVLDLGCGWGAFSLFAAQRYPDSRFTAVSHSRSQRAFIEAEALLLGLENLEVVTRDVNDLVLTRESLDRVVSIEMFEHMSNYERLFERITRWLRPDGALFVHVFCHHDRPYRFEDDGPGAWMAREFFTGGMMPSRDLLPHFAGELTLESDWFVDGTHYARTANAWLARLDERRDEVRSVLAATYGEAETDRRLERWRLFFLAVAETFGYAGGTEWGVAHHRFRKPRGADGPGGSVAPLTGQMARHPDRPPATETALRPIRT
ncbi:MAG: cyclopropane-fatty-acyl-phospholipid synthase family protein [Gemmatimonadota bacterium]|nr:cyclopropane-fatty-acyl-phospholipid synthase family protein [Gemmatimonadota bacterium]